jgi:molybdate transport system substrate-binding protein
LILLIKSSIHYKIDLACHLKNLMFFIILITLPISHLINMNKINLLSCFFIIYVLSTTHVAADVLRVAVASNFYPTMKLIAKRYELKTGGSSGQQHKVVLIPGSSGKHFAQIMNGAPFDVFFSADEERPRLLEKEGKAQTGTRYTYALGKLVLWSPIDGFIDSEGSVLKQKDFRYLAIANPKISPYGTSAEEVLRSLKIWDNMQDSMVRGENITQTFQFVRSSNAKLGFVAYSQIMNPRLTITGSFWEVPQSIYKPIQQQAILLKDSSIGKEFLSFVQSDESLSIISKSGYGLP